MCDCAISHPTALQIQESIGWPADSALGQQRGLFEQRTSAKNSVSGGQMEATRPASTVKLFQNVVENGPSAPELHDLAEHFLHEFTSQLLISNRRKHILYIFPH